MKHINGLLSLMLVAAVLSPAPGCSRSEAPVSSTARENIKGIEIVKAVRDESRRVFRAEIARNNESRNVIITRADEAPLPLAMKAEIRDEKGNMLYRIELAFPPGQDGIWFLEQTASDMLTASISRTSDRVYERYEINGDKLAIDYPRLDDEAMDKIVARYLRGEALDSAPEVEEVGARLADFGAFYERHLGNTLNNNPDGELLMTLLNDQSFADLVTGNQQSPQLIKDRLKRTCWAAVTCASFKCKLGGLANPLCDACAGVAAACIIAEIACWFLGCDCCF
jgi:hypothetical protein